MAIRRLEIFFISILFFSIYGFATEDVSLSSQWEAIQKNNEGVEQLVAEDTEQAYKSFVEALAEEPFNSTIHINLGVFFELNKEPGKALKEYLTAINKSKAPQVRFFALFNAANRLGENKKYVQALRLYQEALKINPSSREVKTNIELLIQDQQSQSQKNKDKQDDKGGKGKDDKKKKDKKDQKDDKKDQKKQEPQQQKKEKKKPKPFKSKELTEKDVKRILEELKNQEQKIRTKVNKKSAKEKPRAKDW